MPYIKPDDRKKFVEVLNQIPEITTKGELEYCISVLMDIYMMDKEMRYSTLHDCSYAAQHCCDEFRRRFLDERENKAKTENGDVFTFYLES